MSVLWLALSLLSISWSMAKAAKLLFANGIMVASCFKYRAKKVTYTGIRGLTSFHPVCHCSQPAHFKTILPIDYHKLGICQEARRWSSPKPSESLALLHGVSLGLRYLPRLVLSLDGSFAIHSIISSFGSFPKISGHLTSQETHRIQCIFDFLSDFLFLRNVINGHFNLQFLRWLLQCLCSNVFALIDSNSEGRCVGGFGISSLFFAGTICSVLIWSLSMHFGRHSLLFLSNSWFRFGAFGLIIVSFSTTKWRQLSRIPESGLIIPVYCFEIHVAF